MLMNLAVQSPHAPAMPKSTKPFPWPDLAACRAIIAFFVLCGLLGSVAPARSALTGYYYNMSEDHPDMQSYVVTGVDRGYVENFLTGATPTLTAYGATRVAQWDWWDPAYLVGSRVDSQTDLQSNFSSFWFPSLVNTGLLGDGYHFAVHWTGSFYVAEDRSYTYSMGSDDDSWLFINKSLVLDLGGVHALSYDSYTLSLSKGYHSIDIFLPSVKLSNQVSN